MSVVSSSDDLSSVLTQAQAAQSAQDATRAHTLFVRATQLAPNNAGAWAGRAQLSSEPDDAIMAWAHALSLSPQDARAQSMLAQCVEQRIAASALGDAHELVALGRDLAKAGQKSFAYQLFVRATELAANNADAWVWRAGSADSPDEAASCLNQALIIEPANHKALSGLHWLLSEKFAPPQYASPARIRRAAEQLLEGQRHLTAGDKAHALASFVRATELDHKNESAWLWRASLTLDIDQALLCVEQALVLNPKNQAALDARKYLRARKRAAQPQAIPPAAEPIAPIQVSEVTPAPNQRVRILLLVVSIVVLILLLFRFLTVMGFLH